MVILPLNFVVNEIVTIAVAICKKNLKRFLKLSLTAHLWLLVPVYGWAKYLAIAALISRLSLHDLLNDRSFSLKKHHTTLSSLITFLFTGLLAIVIPALLSFSVIFALIFVYILLKETIFSGIPFSLADSLNLVDNQRLEVIIGLLILLALLLIIALFYGRFFVCDLSYPENSPRSTFQSIKKSYEITKHNPHIFRIIIRTSMVVFPIWAVSYLLLSILLGVVIFGLVESTPLEINTSDSYLGLYLMIFWLPLANLLSMPLWQTVKATTYYKFTEFDDYDLMRNRRR